MRIRVGSIGVLLIAGLLVACVPNPPDRGSPSGQGAVATPNPTPIPTPVGPTPSPSYVRPTPTPQPSFFVYTVVSGDSLAKIAKHYGTSVRSIAYWNRAAYPSLDPDSGHYKPNYLVVGWKLQLIPHAEVDPENLPGETPGPSTASGPTAEPTDEYGEDVVTDDQATDQPVDEPTADPSDTVD
jgi:hypothetical protein